MRSIGNWCVGLGLSLSLFPQCGSKIEDPGSDSSTHFFGRCDADAECGEGLSCECNRCTVRCKEADECGEFANASCAAAATLESCTLEAQLCIPLSESADAGLMSSGDLEPTTEADTGLSSPEESSSAASSDNSTEPLEGSTDSEGPSDSESSAEPSDSTEPSDSDDTVSDVTFDDSASNPSEPETVTPLDPEIPEEEVPENGCSGQADCPWGEGAALPVPSEGHTAVAFDGVIYVMGGVTSEDRAAASMMEAMPVEPPSRFASTLAYNPEADSWTAKAPMPVGLYDLQAHRLGQRIYVFAGYNSTGFVNTVQVYDPGTDTWGQATSMPTYRYAFTSGVVDGKAFVIGGQGTADNVPVSEQDWVYKYDVEIFDPETETWSSGTPAPDATAGAASCTLGNQIFVFGGEVSNLTSIYDASTDSWSNGTPPPRAKNGHECAVVDSSLFLFGGRDATGTLSTVDKYDPATGTWEAYSPMPTARYWFGAAALDHNVFLFGGEQYVQQSTPTNNYGLLSTVEVFNVEPLP